MRILQYNIYFGDHPGVTIKERTTNVCRCILEQNADVLCLQEVLRELYGHVVQLLQSEYPYVYPDPEDGILNAYDTVIFSRHPIKRATKHKFEFTSMGRDIKLALITDDTDSKYYICTVHFESEFKDGCMKKIYQYSRCSDILYQLYKKTNIPVILCADTNTCEKSSLAFHNAFSYAHGWRDAWIESGSSKEHEITFDSEKNPILRSRYTDGKQMYRSRLDRVLHLSNLHIDNFKLFGDDPTGILSDHYGVICELTPQKPEGRGDYVSPHISPNGRVDVKSNEVKKRVYVSTKKMFK